ncbi:MULTISPECIES: hypothetical protein [Bacillus cereus group]|uniref:hypothetical protein n=1 Tax=Bacillus cereus group TaxID=86661 RepID=UPI00065BB821|nr:hypothetical protein [Bacillus cereus]KMQ31337.1 DNA polymerase III subunit gamma/tau [Bacillus cereus]KMQ31456.1 DNA polymerase III subunit gamma/tau [Bacillus cereus]KMQ31909.1 DNA polymerase III subunit gamma/tau [Bacillus cereus]PFF82513.1 DNA polymerase III subunit gamma/tau [Bacillus cereus]
MSAIHTAYYDLMGMSYLLRLQKNQKNNAVHLFPLARDICLILYQINKELFDDSISIDPNIKKIRHRVKLYEKRDNINIYNRIMDFHINQFGNDIDNLGFYLKERQLVGSTIYPTYIFIDTDFFPDLSQESQIDFKSFFVKVGETINLLMDKLVIDSNGALEYSEFPIFVHNDEKKYRDKDIHDSVFFIGEAEEKIIITRLILSLQEASTCIWLYNILQLNTTELNLDKYILMRLSSIKIDEVMDNIKNMSKFLKGKFTKIDENHNYEFSRLISDYDKDIGEECRVLRNMIHYNKNDVNFLDYLHIKLADDSTYIDGLLNKIINNYMEPLCLLITNYLDVDNKRSMSDWEKISKRLHSRLSGILRR